MSLTDSWLLPNLYSGLSTPNISPPSTPPTLSRQPSRHHLNGQTHPLDNFHTLNHAPALHSQMYSSQSIPNFCTRHTHPKDSLSRSRAGQLPILEHLLSVGNSRTLSLQADNEYIYSGAQSEQNEITVFSRTTLQVVKKLLGHEGSVLALLLVPEKNWLISSSSDGTIRIWSTTTLSYLSLILPYNNASGDIYSLAWDPRSGGTLYMGAQNTDIQYLNFSPTRSAPSPPVISVPSSRTKRIDVKGFFQSGPASPASSINGSPDRERGRTMRYPLREENGTTTGGSDHSLLPQYDIPQHRVISSAHFGYVYSLKLVTRQDGEVWLVSGSAEDLKGWKCLPGGGLEHVFTVDDLPGAVLSLEARHSLLYAGLQDGQIKVFDLETKACIRTVLDMQDDVMSLSILGTDLYVAGANGQVLRFNESFDCTADFVAHDFAILSALVVDNGTAGYHFITAGRRYIKIWTISSSSSGAAGTTNSGMVDIQNDAVAEMDGDVMLYALSKLVRIPTVSDDAHREHCRRGAHTLKGILTQLGGSAKLLPSMEGKNPLVLCTFTGQGNQNQNQGGKPRKRVLFYGHYDVQPAGDGDWSSDPWALSGRNGYLYGRGVADNKGPIIAVACAVASLRDRRLLDVDVVLLVEGEEEAGSAGFEAAAIKAKAEIGHIDCILLSNSSWVGEEEPCIVYGMRGVIYASLEISSDHDDAHSGVDGGTVAEPMLCLVQLLSSISKDGKLRIPGFYDDVHPQEEEEKQTYEAVSKATGLSLETLRKKWREPTFSVANIVSSGPANNTIIPRQVTANVSFRLVPDQKVDVVVKSIEDFCQEEFASFDSSMQLKVNIKHKARWWLAASGNPFFQSLEKALTKVWGQGPLRIREGGSIPTIPFLEQLFEAPCVHLPMGQHSSAAHLSNERLRLLNIRNGKRVIEEFLLDVGLDSAESSSEAL